MRTWRPSALCVLVGLASLLPEVASDALDIAAQLYRDPNCFERAEELTLLDGGCYANLYSNLTRAYLVRQVGFGSSERFDLYEYIATCHKEYQYSSRPRTITGGRCTRFVGPYYVMMKSASRSNTCVGTDCSSLIVAVQHFFDASGCAGLPSHSYRYPLQRACLRYGNGTQTFQVDATFSNITQVDYVADDVCSGGFRRTYAITNRRCYSLYPDKTPRSFSWTVEAATTPSVGVTSGAPRRRMIGASLLALAAPLATFIPTGD